MSAAGEKQYVYARYQADVWVEVDPDEAAVTRVVVDDESMAEPVEVVTEDGSQAPVLLRRAVQQVLDTDTWPSWDYGIGPFWDP